MEPAERAAIPNPVARMQWIQREIELAPRPRGFHVITHEVLGQMGEIREFRVGMLHLFLQHTSASLTLNENASPEVRPDLEDFFNRAVPEKVPGVRHRLEGPDDMPAHIKASLLGSGLLVPVGEGRVRLGTWQGIMLCEHRDRGGPRRLVATLFGESAAP